MSYRVIKEGLGGGGRDRGCEKDRERCYSTEERLSSSLWPGTASIRCEKDYHIIEIMR